MNATLSRIAVTLVLLFALQGAWAIDLDSAKSEGLVGEANTGYLAAVSGSPGAEVEALIAEVNRKRKAEFENTAAKTGATLEQVRARFYALAVQRTAPGHYYQDSGGRWVRK